MKYGVTACVVGSMLFSAFAWDFHSLSLGIQMMFSFMLTDEKNPLRMCEQCHRIFIGKRTDAKFCRPECKNQHNVSRSRGKQESEIE
ncbi:MAG: hypothetical protein FWE08_03955 [Oscillospiraceae bacterium]|nr:hypothetical protein [Oscillospiraceae bacterium]